MLFTFSWAPKLSPTYWLEPEEIFLAGKTDEGGKGGAVSVFWRSMDQRVFESREKEIKNGLQRLVSEDLTKTNMSEKINKPLDNWQTVGKGS